MGKKKTEELLLEMIIKIDSKLDELKTRIEIVENSRSIPVTKEDDKPVLFSLNSTKEKEKKEKEKVINPKLDKAADLMVEYFKQDPPIRKVVRD